MSASAPTKDYIVVFRRASGPGQGVVTWTLFASKEEFEREQNEIKAGGREVIEEGVSSERALELVRKAPFIAYLNVAYHEATGADGRVDSKKLTASLTKFTSLLPHRRSAEVLFSALAHVLAHN